MAQVDADSLLDHVPVDVWLAILEACHSRRVPLANLASSCTFFNELARRHFLFRTLNFTNRGDRHDVKLATLLVDTPRWCSRTESVCLNYFDREGDEQGGSLIIPGVPEAVTSAMLVMTKLSRLESRKIMMTPAFITLLSKLPSLTDICLLGGCRIADGFSDGAGDCLHLRRIELGDCEYSNASDLDAFLSALCTPALKSLRLVPLQLSAHFFQTLVPRLSSAELESLAMSMHSLDDEVLTDLFTQQSSVKELTDITGSLFQWRPGPLPPRALPNLRSYTGGSDALSALAPGRPLDSVVLSFGLHLRPVTERLDSMFEALKRATVPLRDLMLLFQSSGEAFNADLLGKIIQSFPHLETLSIWTTKEISADFLATIFTEQISSLHKCQNISFKWPRAASVQGASETPPEEAHWQRERVSEWGAKCPSLRRVHFFQTQWVRAGVTDWRSFAFPERNRLIFRWS